MAYRIRFNVYDPTTGRRLTRHSDEAELAPFVKAAVRARAGVYGWVMSDGRVRIDSHSAPAIRDAYHAVRRYADTCGWNVDFTLTANAAKVIPAPQRHLFTIRPNGPSRVLATERIDQ